MSNEITATGLTTATRTEIIGELDAAMRLIFGNDINLESNTPDGQLLNIFTQVILDEEDLITQVYNSFDPDNAIGVVLDQRVAINGIQRQAGTFTTTNLTIVNSQSVNLYGLDQADQPVFTAQDNAGNNWNLITTSLGVSAGSHILLFQAEKPGQILTVPNTITIPVTIVLGVTSINNPTVYATLGVNEETDAQLRIRRQKSVALRGQGYLQGLIAALENINGIVTANVYENVTSSTDANSIPGHSIWVVVSGTPSVSLSVAYNATTVYAYGNIASSGGINYISIASSNIGNAVTNASFWAVYNPIAQTIYNYRNAGCGMFGSQSYTITQINGLPFTILWDFVIAENLFIKFTAYSLNGTAVPSIAAIKSYLVSHFLPGVNQEVNINQISTYVQQQDPNTLVLSSGFSTSSSGSYTNTLTPSTLNRQFVVSAPNIIVLPILMSCPGATPVFVSGLVTNFTISIANLSTLQYTPQGGYGAYIYAVLSGSGSIDIHGLFTSAGAGTTVIQVTDELFNTAISTVTVV